MQQVSDSEAPPPHALHLDAEAGPEPGPGDALLVVDMQRDFLPGGSLAVPGGADVLPAVNAWIRRFERARRPVYLSRDWHPPDHVSFRPEGGPWPVHAVAHSAGAAFCDGLKVPAQAGIVSKGCTREGEAYSAFEGTDLQHRLHARHIRSLVVVGVATDYCVLHTVLDARAHGYEVVVPRDAIAAVELRAGDAERALVQMQRAGALLLRPRGAPAAMPALAAVQTVAASSRAASARSAGETSTR